MESLSSLTEVSVHYAHLCWNHRGRYTIFIAQLLDGPVSVLFSTLIAYDHKPDDKSDITPEETKYYPQVNYTSRAYILPKCLDSCPLRT